MFEEELFLSVDFPAELFFGGHIRHVFCSEELSAVIEHGIAGYCRICIGAQENTYGRIVIGSFHHVVVHTDIHIELPDIGMGHFMSLELKDDEAFHTEIIENEIDIEVIEVRGDMLLAFYEGETSSKFKDEFLEIVDKCLFKLGFVVFGIRFQAHEFSNCRILYVFQRVFVVEWSHGIRQYYPGGLSLLSESALVVLRRYVSSEGLGAPHTLRGLGQIPDTGRRVCNG